MKWLTNTNIPNGLAGKKNVLANIWFLSESMKGYILVNPLFIYFLLGLFFYFKKPEVKNRIIYFGSLATLVLTAVILRFQFIPHYLFGLSFFLFFNALILFLNLKIDVFKKILIIFFLVYEIIVFWKTPYVPSWRTPERFEKAVNYVIKNNLVSKTNFNIIQITKQNLLATLGLNTAIFLEKMVIGRTRNFYTINRKSWLFFPKYLIRILVSLILGGPNSLVKNILKKPKAINYPK
jgi:hypothetical protein